jgi:chorismate mutase
VSIQDQAIQIERLKYERDEAKNAIFTEILSVSREIDSITNEMFRLGEKRKKLYDKLGELKEKRARDEAHYALVISARQALTKRDKEAKKP